MFPLGTVLLPGAPLPLQVFEPRYRELTRDCLAGVPEFGVVLIERGSEVGGGDVRTNVGTVAHIVASQVLPDGRAYLMTVGTRRIEVTEWLEDAPYPRAMVEEFVDDGGPPSAEVYAALVGTARRTLALASELGLDAGEATRDFGDDPAAGTFEFAAVTPLGMLDRQRVLAAVDAAERCSLLDGLLSDLNELLSFQLGGEPGGRPGGSLDEDGPEAAEEG